DPNGGRDAGSGSLRVFDRDLLDSFEIGLAGPEHRDLVDTDELIRAGDEEVRKPRPGPSIEAAWQARRVDRVDHREALTLPRVGDPGHHEQPLVGRISGPVEGSLDAAVRDYLAADLREARQTVGDEDV